MDGNVATMATNVVSVVVPRTDAVDVTTIGDTPSGAALAHKQKEQSPESDSASESGAWDEAAMDVAEAANWKKEQVRSANIRCWVFRIGCILAAALGLFAVVLTCMQFAKEKRHYDCMQMQACMACNAPLLSPVRQRYVQMTNDIMKA